MSESILSQKEKKKKNTTKIYLIIASIVFGILILPSIPMIMMSAMMFDSPGSQDSIPTITLVICLVAYPFITFLSIIIAWILFVRKILWGAILSASLPFLNILIGIAAIIYMSIFCDGNLAC